MLLPHTIEILLDGECIHILEVWNGEQYDYIDYVEITDISSPAKAEILKLMATQASKYQDIEAVIKGER